MEQSIFNIALDQLEEFGNKYYIKIIANDTNEYIIDNWKSKKQWCITMNYENDSDYIVLLDKESVKQYFEEMFINSIEFN